MWHKHVGDRVEPNPAFVAAGELAKNIVDFVAAEVKPGLPMWEKQPDGRLSQDQKAALARMLVTFFNKNNYSSNLQNDVEHGFLDEVEKVLGMEISEDDYIDIEEIFIELIDN